MARRRQSRFTPAIVECIDRDRMRQAITLVLCGGICLAVAGLCIRYGRFDSGTPGRPPSVFETAGWIGGTLLAASPGVVFLIIAVPRLRPGPPGRLIINAACRTLTAENVVIERGFWPRRTSDTFAAEEIRRVRRSPGFRGGPAFLTITTDRGVVRINENWTDFPAVCMAMPEVIGRPIEEWRVTPRQFALIAAGTAIVGVGLALGVVWLVRE